MKKIMAKLLFQNKVQVGSLLWSLFLSLTGNVVLGGVREAIRVAHTFTYSYSSSMGDLLLVLQIILYIASGCFVLYAVKNYVLNNLRTHSILSILGCPFSTLIKITLAEVIILFLLSTLLAAAAAAGVLFVLWRCVYTLSFPVSFASLLSWRQLLIALAVNMVALFIVVIPNLAKLSKADFSILLVKDAKKDRITNKGGGYLFGGLALVLFAFFLVAQPQMMYHLLAVLFFLLGFSLLFNRGIIALYTVFKKRPSYYFKHLLAINNFFARFFQTRKVLFLTFMTGFMILFVGGVGLSSLPADFNADYYTARFPNNYVIIAKEVDALNSFFKQTQTAGEIDASRSLLFESSEATRASSFEAGEVFSGNGEKILCISSDTMSAITGKRYSMPEKSAMVIGLRAAEDFKPFSDSTIILANKNRRQRVGYHVLYSGWQPVFGEFRNKDADLLIVLPNQDYTEFAKQNPSGNCAMAILNGIPKETFTTFAKELQQFSQANPSARIFDGKQFAALYYAEDFLSFFALALLALFLLIYITSINIVGLNSEISFLIQKYRTVFWLGMEPKAIRKNLLFDTIFPGVVTSLLSTVAAFVFVCAEALRSYDGNFSALGHFSRVYLIFILCYFVVIALFYATTIMQTVRKSVKRITKEGYDDSDKHSITQ